MATTFPRPTILQQVCNVISLERFRPVLAFLTSTLGMDRTGSRGQPIKDDTAVNRQDRREEAPYRYERVFKSNRSHQRRRPEDKPWNPAKGLRRKRHRQRDAAEVQSLKHRSFYIL